MLIKLGLSKYFDKLSWSYISQTLKVFGFLEAWISLIPSPHFLDLLVYLS